MVEVVVSSVPLCGCVAVVVACVSGFWMVEVVVSSVPPPPVDVGLWLLLVFLMRIFLGDGQTLLLGVYASALCVPLVFALCVSTCLRFCQLRFTVCSRLWTLSARGLLWGEAVVS